MILTVTNAVGALAMKGKIISLLLIAWGGTILISLAIYWDPFGDKAIQGFLALLTGSSLVWSGWRGLRPIKPIDPLSSDYGFVPPEIVKKYRALQETPHRSLPGWAAPLAGIAFGVVISLRLALEDRHWELGFMERLLLGTGLGFGAGCVVWCLDAFRNRAARRAIDAVPSEETFE